VGMMSIARVTAGPMWRYYLRGVKVGDGQRPARKPLKQAKEEAGIPAGVWMGRGLPLLGLSAGGEVTERQMELLVGEGRHPDADRIQAEREAAGDSPGKAKRATFLGRPPAKPKPTPKLEKRSRRRRTSPSWRGITCSGRSPRSPCCGRWGMSRPGR
jgi:hypothetical protein